MIPLATSAQSNAQTNQEPSLQATALLDAESNTSGQVSEQDNSAINLNNIPRIPIAEDFVPPQPAESQQVSISSDLVDSFLGDPEPMYKVSREEYPFNTWLTRVSDNSAFDVSDGDATHAYSRRQAWNADESLLLIDDIILDAISFERIGNPVPVSSERVWANTHPDLMFAIVTDPKPVVFGYLNVRDGQFIELVRFDEFDLCTFGHGEGNLSNDDQLILFSCVRQDTDEPTLISYNVKFGYELGRLDVQDDFNWGSYSQTGEYILVEFNDPDTKTNERLVRYQSDFTQPTTLSTVRYHGDLGLDNEGNDVFVMIGEFQVSYLRLFDGLKVNIPVSNIDNPLGQGHVSCRNIFRPGWCYISTYLGSRVAAVRIAWDGTGNEYIDNDQQVARIGVAEFEPWGFHRSTSTTYKKIAKASSSPSGNRVVFTSDWYGNGDTLAYTLERFRPGN